MNKDELKNEMELKNETMDESILQWENIKKCRELLLEQEKEYGRKFTYCVTTFGCQMNARDSEKLEGVLKEVGYVPASEEHADFVIFNTCTVRDNANQRVYGRLGVLKGKKRNNPHMKIAVCGCMMQEPSVVLKIKKSYPFVDLIFGTHNIFKFPEYLLESLTNKKPVNHVWNDTNQIVENLPVERKYTYKSGINIMFGCNNFCTYCIVPYVRGRERSRSQKDILKEINTLAKDGVTEIMLLGQNVNSYGKNFEPPITFAMLLKEIEKIDKIKRIRFMTSHPKDLSDELIETIKNSKKIARHLHLPLQSGSTKILTKMNRRYTKESYLDLAYKIKKEIPDISLTTDLIIGFPGETDQDIEDTIDVIQKAGYDQAFTYIYSKRTGTPAADMENQVPKEIIQKHFNRVLDVVHETSAKNVVRYLGGSYEVLVEEINTHDHTFVTGRMSNNILVHFKGDQTLIGTYVMVRLTECKGFYFFGVKEE